MVAIRKSRAKPKADLDSEVMELPHGAHIKVKTAKYFGPKFDKPQKDKDNPDVEETFWAPKIRVRFCVLDDRTATGDFDDCEFWDDLYLKLDMDVLDETGFDERRLKDSPPKSNFTNEEQEILLNESNWTFRDGTKAGNYLSVALGEAWANGDVKLDEDLVVGTEAIAKIQPRTGKNPGSYCEWNGFLSVHPPKKQKKSRGKKAEMEAAVAKS